MGGGYNCECILKNLALPKDSSGLCPQQGDLQDLGTSVRSVYVCFGALGHQIDTQGVIMVPCIAQYRAHSHFK